MGRLLFFTPGMPFRKVASVPPRQWDMRRHLGLFRLRAGYRPLRRGDRGAVPWLQFARRGTVQAMGLGYLLPQRQRWLDIPCLLYRL